MSGLADQPMQDGTPVVASEKPYVPPPMSIQQEDAIIHMRITNDEKALRRVTKKFHNYASVANTTAAPFSPSTTSPVDDAREAFLVELASFHLSLKKNLMVCEAEARQVQEYQRERERIASEHHLLQGQIEHLKTSLEYAQLERKRKIEYDAIAEKINTLPSRDELNRTISLLENDMAAIRSEHENQTRTLQSQKAALDDVILDLNALRLMGKHHSADPSPADTPAPEVPSVEEDFEMDGSASVRTREESGELREDKEEGEDDKESDDDVPLARVILNPGARPFLPGTSRTSTPALRSSTTRSTPVPTIQVADEDDIEMGEVAEEPKEFKPLKKKAREEELEEGEASDESSELSEPPDD